MLELAPDIFYLPGKNRSRFPYCACLYVKGKNLRILIDAGMGGSHLEPVKRMGIDVLVMTHCHIDHRLTRREIPEVPVWCHPDEVPYLTDKDQFYAGTGIGRAAIDLSWVYEQDEQIFEMQVTRTLHDGETIDLGGLTLQTLLTPGHSPGHLSFFIPEHGILFSGDIDLTPFGPFYGHDFADIDDFVTSIERLRGIQAGIVATGHAGPFNGNSGSRFRSFRQIIETREEKLLANLRRPITCAELVGRGIIYKHFGGDNPYVDLTRWFEQVHIEKHLYKLSAAGRIQQDPNSGCWFE